jgi:hypothetical protein
MHDERLEKRRPGTDAGGKNLWVSEGARESDFYQRSSKEA